MISKSLNVLLLLLVSLFTASSVRGLSANNNMKRVLVTGGNKGIGRAICAELLSKNPDVYVLLGSRDGGRGAKTVEELKASIKGSEGRIECVELDVSSEKSVTDAAETLSKLGEGCLYGIVNNAGVYGDTYEESINVNYFGTRRVNEAFGKYIQKPGGRVVNIASASGPMYVASCGDRKLRSLLADPSTISGGVQELDGIAKSYLDKKDYGGDSYGLSKALVNAYTVIHAKSEPDLIINSCTPGFINTDMTRNAGMGATNPPVKGTISPLHCLMSEDISKVPTGRYYGSDAVRSPLDRYRGPGDPPFEGP